MRNFGGKKGTKNRQKTVSSKASQVKNALFWAFWGIWITIWVVRAPPSLLTKKHQPVNF